MNLFARLSFLLVTIGFVLSTRAIALPSYITFPSDVDWVTRETDHFDIIYRRGQDQFALRTLRAAERAYKLLTPIFPEAPSKTWIVLADFHDSTNGYALTFPYPHMVIFAAPPESGGQLANLDNWLDSVVLHEYVHILHIYPANGLWGIARAVFGSWVVPNGLMPGHFHEGLAVMLETEKSKGGRGRGATFSMYRRMAVDAKVWGTSDFLSRDRMDGVLSIFPHGSSSYLFGWNLYRELWQRKGGKGIYDLVLDHSSNLPYFVNLPLENVYGLDYPTLWPEIFKKTTDEENKAIAVIKNEGLSELEIHTHSKFNKANVVLSPNGKFVAYRRWNPEWGPAIEIISPADGDRPLRKIEVSTNSAEGMCWFESLGKQWLVFIETDNSNNYALNSLRLFDLNEDEKRSLVTDRGPLKHVHQVSCSENGDTIVTYQENAGTGWIREYDVKLSKEDDGRLQLRRQWKLPTSTWATSVLAGPDHWFGIREGMSTAFYRWSRTKEPVRVDLLPGHFYNFRKSNRPTELNVIANVEGRDEIWGVNFGNKEFIKRVTLLGGTNSFDWRGNKAYFANYRHGGYDIASATFNEVKTAKFTKPELAGEERELAAQMRVSEREEYSPLGSLLPRAWVPSALFVPAGLQVGAWIPGFDISQRHYYNIIGGYDTRGLPFGDFNYTHRFGSNYSVTGDVFYFPSYIQSSRNFFKRWGSSIAVGGSFGAGWPSWQLAAIFRRVEAVGQFPENQSVGLQATLSQRFGINRRPVSISPVAGTTVSLSHGQFFKFLGSKDNYFSTVGSVEQFLENPFWKEHVLYLNAKVGYTEGTPLYNNFFEAGGELLFYQNRGTFLNRGFLPGTFLNRRVVNFNIEYRFPIALIERGINYFPLQWKTLHAALTTDITTFDFGALSTAPKNLLKIFYVSSGLELRSDWTLAFYVPAIFRVGAYHGFGDYGESLYVTFGIEASI